MALKRQKSQSIHPLHGGYGGYIETLEKVRRYVDDSKPATREELISWYSENIGRGMKVGIHSLFRSGLLEEDDGRIKRVLLPRGKVHRNRRVVEIINDHVVYILDMLNEARDGATIERLHELGKSKYGLSDGSNINQILKEYVYNVAGRLCGTKANRRRAIAVCRQMEYLRPERRQSGCHRLERKEGLAH